MSRYPTKLFCGCFGGVPTASPPQTPPVNCEDKYAADRQRAAQEVPRGTAPVAFQVLNSLRTRLACSDSCWAPRLSAGASEVAEACNAGLVGLMGTTRDPDGQTSLVVLASVGPASPSLPLGELLPVPQQAMKCVSQLGPPPLSLPPWEPPRSLLPMAPQQQQQQQQPQPKSQDQPQQRSQPSVPAALAPQGPSADFVVLCDETWQRVLGGLQATCPTSGPRRWHVILVPLCFGAELAGAMLLALPAGGAVSSSNSTGAGDLIAGLETSGGGNRAASRAPLLEPLLSQGGLLESLGACVAECCLGPILSAVEQVCSSCSLVESASSLQQLSTALTVALTSNLSDALHVDLGVRLALLPSRDALQGVLFEDAAKLRTAGGGGGGGVGPFQRSASVSFIMHGAGGAAAQQPSPQASMRGPAGLSQRDGRASCDPMTSVTRLYGAVATGTSGGGIGFSSSARVSVLQAAAARAAAVAAVPVSADDELALAPATHGSLMDGSGHLAGAVDSAPSLTGARRGGARTTQSGRSQIRATTFSLACTLAAKLLSAPNADVGTGASTLRASSSGLFASMGIAAAAAAPPPLPHLASAVIANVATYLHDAEQPTSDVFIVFRRAGTAPCPASLVAIAGWLPAAASARGIGIGTGTGGCCCGGGRLGLPPNADPLAPHLSHTPGHTMDRRDKAGRPLAGAGAATTATAGAAAAASTCVINATGTTSMSLAPWDATAAPAAAPAFVVYLTSALPLTPQLLVAVRDRGSALLEVLLPAAGRALAGAVQDEWSYLGAVACGSMPFNGPLSNTAASEDVSSMSPRTYHQMGAGERPMSTNLSCRNSTGTGMAAPAHQEAAQSPHSMRSLRSPGTAPAAPTPGPTLDLVGGFGARAIASGPSGPQPPMPPSSPARVIGSGTISRYAAGGAAERTPRAAESPLLAAPNASGERWPRGVSVSYTSASGARTLTGTSRAARGAVGPGTSIPCHHTSSGFVTVPDRQQHAPVETTQSQHFDASSFLTTTGLMGLDEDGPASGSMAVRSGGGGGGGGSNTCGSETTAGASLTTVLSDARDMAKAERQVQLDIMVSTFHSALCKARNDAGTLAGAHAEDDIRALRLLKTIGQGGCSVVLLGRLHSMPVAVKVILPPEEDAEDAPQQQQQQQPPALLGTDSTIRSTNNSVLVSDRTGATGTGPGWARPLPAARQLQMRLLMRGARELAVMTSISHPAIVQVYSFCTRVVVVQPQGGTPQLDVVPEGAAVTAPLCTALIMEYCDMGSLADAVDTGAFARATKTAAAALQNNHKTRASQSAAMGRADRTALQEFVFVAALAGGSSPMGRSPQVSSAVAATAGTPSMRAIYLTLLEVALALRHLHSMNLVHCDVKPANVLLRSSATDPRGFTAKLTDFGFVNLMEQRCSDQGTRGSSEGEGGGISAGGRATMRFAEPVGTVTHMAPELFVKGNVVDSSIDMYAFGILMWELSTGRAPYPEYAEGQFMEVPYKVVKEGLRPRFPSDTPLHFKLLAQECWTSLPVKRPTAAALVSRLQRLLDLSCGFAQAGAGGL